MLENSQSHPAHRIRKLRSLAARAVAIAFLLFANLGCQPVMDQVENTSLAASPTSLPQPTETPLPTSTPFPTLPSIPTATAAQLSPTPTEATMPQEVKNLLKPEYSAVHDQVHNWWIVTDRDGRGNQLYKTDTKEIVKMKPGSLVQIDKKWYRYIKETKKLIEWDVWEPGFKLEFTGTVEGIKIPITLGLMPDIMESQENPILEIMLNPDRPDAADRFAYYILRQCWNNYNREHKKDPATWSRYLELVKKGEGKIRVPYNDNSVGSWNGAQLGTVGVAELSPTEGIRIFIPDTLHNTRRDSLMNWNTDVVVMHKGKLTILHPIIGWEKISDLTKEMQEFNIILILADAIQFVLLDRDIGEVMEIKSHLFDPRDKTSSDRKDIGKAQTDSNNNIVPYFQIKTP